jgi:lipopolysaccharide export system protein LptC
MTVAVPMSLWMRARRVWDHLSVYLPLVLMGLMAMSTYWLVHNTPVAGDAELEAAPRHVPDYFMRDFSVKIFADNGKLKSEMKGVEARHFPDTDTLEIDQPRLRILGAEGRVTTAVATRGLINADGSEAQLFDKAVVVREASRTQQGVVVPRSELQSDFLHVFANTEQVRTHLPVVLVRGASDRFTAQEGMSYDNLNRVMQLHGRVRGTLLPPSGKK